MAWHGASYLLFVMLVRRVRVLLQLPWVVDKHPQRRRIVTTLIMSSLGVSRTMSVHVMLCALTLKHTLVHHLCLRTGDGHHTVQIMDVSHPCA